MYPDLSYSEVAASTETLVLGVAPQKTYVSPQFLRFGFNPQFPKFDYIFLFYLLLEEVYDDVIISFVRSKE